MQAVFGFPTPVVHITQIGAGYYVGGVNQLKPTLNTTAPKPFITYATYIIKECALLEFAMQDKKWRAAQEGAISAWPNLGPRVNEFYRYIVSIRNVMHALSVDLNRLWNSHGL